MQKRNFIELDPGLLNSTVWTQPATTAVVWLTLRLAAGPGGVVRTSIPGLANLANVTLEQCEAALSFLARPDPYNTNQEALGRRVQATQDGWVLLEQFKSEERVADERRRAMNAARQRRFRQRQRERGAE